MPPFTHNYLTKTIVERLSKTDEAEIAIFYTWALSLFGSDPVHQFKQFADSSLTALATGLLLSLIDKDFAQNGIAYKNYLANPHTQSLKEARLFLIKLTLAALVIHFPYNRITGHNTSAGRNLLLGIAITVGYLSYLDYSSATPSHGTSQAVSATGVSNRGVTSADSTLAASVRNNRQGELTKTK